MKAEYLILGLVILAGLAVGYTFFQISDQNGIRFDKSNIDTNKSVPTDQGGSSSQGTSSSNQVNNPNQRHICPTCGGNGYIDYTEENGEPSVEICPTCGGSGYI